MPVLWADGPEPFAGALVFRVGLADETLATLGLSHFVEHLALHRGGRQRFDVNGFVDETRTVFWAAGTREEVCGFLSDVAAAIGSLPLERLDTERRVLLTEAQGRAAHPLGLLLRCRFGVTGFGLLDCVELGLRRVDVDEVAAWAREWFTSGNAAVWLTGPPTDDFSLPLPEGARRLQREATPIPGLELPAHLETGSGAVQLAFLAPRSVAAAAAAELAGERADEDLRTHAGLSYAAGGLYWPLTATTAHLSWRADCLDEHALEVRARLLAALESLADPGPTSEQLADYAVRSRRMLTDPRAIPAYLDSTVHNLLIGASQETPEELLDRVASLTGDDVAAVVRKGLPTMLLVSPERTPPPARGFLPYLEGSDRMTPVDGVVYPTKGWRSKSRIVVGPAGSSFVDDASGAVVTILAEDVVALLSLGAGRLSIAGATGSDIILDARSFDNGDELVADLRRRFAHVTVPLEDLDGSDAVDRIASLKLKRRWTVTEELELLPAVLAPGEELVTLAEANHGRKGGMIALTDRRLLFLYKGIRNKADMQIEIGYEAIESVRATSFAIPGVWAPDVWVGTADKELKFKSVLPRERAAEIADEIRARARLESL